jgi:hypothetical protein
MNWCCPFQGVGSSSAPPTSLSHWGSLTELLWCYAPTHHRFIWCWRPCGQIVFISFYANVGWTTAQPSVHLVLKASSWHVSVLFKLDHRIDRRLSPMDRRFIRRCCFRGFSSPIHPTQLWKGPSVHPTVSSWLQSLRSVPSAPTLCTDGPSVHPMVSFSFFFFASSTWIFAST